MAGGWLPDPELPVKEDGQGPRKKVHHRRPKGLELQACKMGRAKKRKHPRDRETVRIVGPQARKRKREDWDLR